MGSLNQGSPERGQGQGSRERCALGLAHAAHLDGVVQQQRAARRVQVQQQRLSQVMGVQGGKAARAHGAGAAGHSPKSQEVEPEGGGV